MLDQEDEARWRVPSEDFDAAPGFEVSVRDTKAITSWCLDHYNNVIWTGAYSLQRSKGRLHDTCFLILPVLASAEIR